MYINTGPGVDQAGRRAVSPSGHQSSFSRLCLTRDEVLLLPQRRYPHYSHRRTLCTAVWICMYETPPSICLQIQPKESFALTTATNEEHMSLFLFGPDIIFNSCLVFANIPG